jgi:endoglucanase
MRIATLLLFFVVPMHVSASQQTEACGSVTKDTCKIVAKMGKGINLGEIFEAPYEGAWRQWYEDKYVDEISSKFSTVRIPVRWSNFASEDQNAEIERDFLERIGGIVKAFLNKDMTVIINLHGYNQIYGNELERGEYEVEPNDVIPRFYSIWKQLSDYFKNHPHKLIFEPLNEPNNQLKAEQWNQLIENVTDIIRRNDPNRILAFGPASWNSAKMLDKLVLPDDPNIITTVHVYEPFDFTHQGVTYLPMNLPKGVSCCNFIQEYKISNVISQAKDWSLRQQRPIYVGEFGVHKSADNEHKVEYIKKNIQLFKEHNINWIYWNFSGQFGAYNSRTSRWNKEMLNALTDS